MAQTTYQKGKSALEDAGDTAGSKANELADRASDKTKEAAESARHYAEKGAQMVEETVHQYPIATVVGAAVAGLIVGALLRS